MDESSFIHNSVLSKKGYPPVVPLSQVKAMQFYGEDLSEALGFAQLFAGIDGHIATLPEIITARAQAPLESLVWNRYYTTVSSEYFGLTKGGSEVVIVAHGTGPLNSIAALKLAYSPVYGRGQDDGYITPKMFARLENGDYGNVEVVDFSKVREARKDRQTGAVTARQAARDPLLKARCGPDWQHVVEKLESETQRQGGGIGNYALTIESESPYGYWHTDGRKNMNFGNLLSTSSVHNMHDRSQVFASINVKTHGRTDGTRFVGVRRGGNLLELHRGPELLSANSEKLLRPYDRETALPRLMTIKQFGSQWFSCRPKEGNGLDTGWPEHPVSNVAVLGKPGRITAPYSPFFKYDVAEVVWGAPDEANAYYLGEPERAMADGNVVFEAPVYYCRVDADTTKLCVTKEELSGDFELQMLLLEQLK